MFIVIEGIDAAGKSSVIENLKTELLIKRKIPTVFTHEPLREGEKIESEISSLLLKSKLSLSLKTQILLFGALRHIHVENIIRPALEKDIMVISDRYFFSSWAYQSEENTLDLSIKDIKNLNDWVTGNLYPDLVIFLELPISSLQSRKQLEKDRFEIRGEKFLEVVAKKYHFFFKEKSKEFLPKKTKLKIIDARQSKAKVNQEVIDTILECLQNKN